MTGVYLAARNDRYYNYDIIYNDIEPKFNCDLVCDMLSVPLEHFDYYIATPPCNYYSRANWRRNISNYALCTKHLLLSILEKFALTGKPFLIENVRNPKLFKVEGIFDICDKFNINVYTIGRHTYFTNLFVNLYCKQQFDFYTKNGSCYSYHKRNDCQGNENVHNVINIWLEYLHAC